MTDKSKNISQPKGYKLIVEKDVKIPMRDGAILYADVFRPDGGPEGRPWSSDKATRSSSTFSRATAWERRFIGTTTPTTTSARRTACTPAAKGSRIWCCR
jgi:hypothetical protein